jgi:tryptophan 2,3-dioxygenase
MSALTPEVLQQLEALAAKYQADGQDLVSFLEGLQMTEYITYWDYVQLDTLLTLQKPRTAYPDEPIFIMYHQITELYFKLCRQELEPLVDGKVAPTKSEILRKVQRVNRYFHALATSFGVMADGMEREQFLKFRLALIPASGFQSAQYRFLEFASTRLEHLVQIDDRARLVAAGADPETLLQHVYWRKGATLEETGEKTLTLKQFEAKYGEAFREAAFRWRGNTLWDLVQALPKEDLEDPEFVQALRALDYQINVDWPLQHYRTAVKYLAKRPSDAPATGGTNWQRYLPPRFQKRIFFPELWTAQEQEEWGKKWVDQQLAQLGDGE